MNLSPSLAGAVALALGLAPAAPLRAAPADSHRSSLEEVVVTAAPFERSPLDIAQPTAVLSGERLRQQLAASIGETVAHQLGLTGTYFGPSASRPVIRGLGGERVQMLEDGIEALDVSALSADHAVSVEGIAADQVEILKGPATLLYGNGAVGGLVNVVTNRIPSTVPETFEGAVELRGDTALEERTGAARFDFGAGPLAFHLDGFRRRTDDVRIPGFAASAAERAAEAAEGEEHEEPRGRIPNSAGDSKGGAFGVSFVGARGFVGVGYRRYESAYGLPGHGEHEEEEAPVEETSLPGTPPVAAATVEAGGPMIDMQQDRYDFAAELEGGGWLQRVRVRATYSDYEHAELEEDGAVGTQFDQSAYEARVAFDHAFGAFRGTAGVQVRDVDFVAVGEEAFVPASRTRNVGAFVLQERPFETARGPVVLEFGGRIERQTVDPDAGTGLPDYRATSVTAAAGLVWKFQPQIALAVNLTHSERQPTATELYADGPHAAVQRFEIGDPALRKERANALDVSLRSAGESRVRWQLNAYVNAFQDFVYLQPTGAVEDDFDVFEYRQADARFAGLEAEVEWALVENDAGALDLRLAGDYVRGTLRAGGGPLPQIPPLRVGAELGWRASRWSAGVSVFRYREQSRVAAFERSTDGYTMLDVDASWRLPTQNGSWLLFARAGNLLDEDARRHTSPLKEIAPLPGRSLTAGVRLEF